MKRECICHVCREASSVYFFVLWNFVVSLNTINNSKLTYPSCDWPHTMNWTSGEEYGMGVSLHSTFAELTTETYRSIAENLVTILGTDTLAKCTLLDVGSGRGKMTIELAAILPLRAAIGVEIDENLHMFAQNNSMKAAHVYPQAGPCLFGRGNLFFLGGINGANIIVAFDRAFGARLKDHLCNLANSSKDTLVLVSCFSDLREKHGKGGGSALHLGSMALGSMALGILATAAHTHCTHTAAPSQNLTVCCQAVHTSTARLPGCTHCIAVVRPICRFGSVSRWECGGSDRWGWRKASSVLL